MAFEPDYLVIDGNNLMFKVLDFSAKYNPRDYEPPKRAITKARNLTPEEQAIEDTMWNWKYNFTFSVFGKITKFKPKKGVIFLYDYKGSWRRDVFPPYKGNRKTKKQVIDKDVFFKYAEEYLNELHGCLSQSPVIKLEGVEADDSIAILVKDNPQDNFLFFSSDSDLYQLYKFPNYRQTADGNAILDIPNPALILEDKIILGDTSDNIPGIKFRTGPKKVAAMRSNNTLYEWIHGDPAIEEAFVRNTRLIDLEHIPQAVVTRIKETYAKFEPRKNDEYALWTLLLKSNMKIIIEWYMNELNAYYRERWV